MCAHPDVITAPAMDASVAAPPGAAPAGATQLPSFGPQLALEYTNWQDFTAAVHAHTTAQMKQVLSHLFPGTCGWRATLPATLPCGTRPPRPGASAGPALETSAPPLSLPPHPQPRAHAHLPRGHMSWCDSHRSPHTLSLSPAPLIHDLPAFALPVCTGDRATFVLLPCARPGPQL